MNFEWNKKNIMLVSFLGLIILGSIIVINIRNPKTEKPVPSKIILLDNYSRFFTVSNCAQSYINYLAKKDANTLNLLLSEDYKIQNNINQNNVLNKLELLTGSDYSFSARKIYKEDLSKAIVKYYIYGYLRETMMDQYVKPTDYYLVIIMDTKHFTYSVIPDDGTLFKEAK